MPTPHGSFTVKRSIIGSVGSKRAFITPAVLLAGAVVGTAIGWLLEQARVRWGDSRDVYTPRIVLLALLGAGVFLIARVFLIRNGRFQFNIKHLMGLTLAWAVALAWLSPQWSRFDQEDRVVRAIEASLGVPVQVDRHGMFGFESVTRLKLPKIVMHIDDAQVDSLIEKFRKLPRLYCIEGDGIHLSYDALERFEKQLPQFHFAGRVIVDRPSTARTAKPAPKDPPDVAPGESSGP